MLLISTSTTCIYVVLELNDIACAVLIRQGYLICISNLIFQKPFIRYVYKQIDVNTVRILAERPKPGLCKNETRLWTLEARTRQDKNTLTRDLFLPLHILTGTLLMFANASP